MAALAAFLWLVAGMDRQAVDASRIALSKPTAVVALSGDALPGFPVRLSWSADGTEIYIRLVRRDRWGNETTFHRVITVQAGLVSSVEREPMWSHTYWALKSAYACPGAPDFRVDSETRTEQVSPTNSGIGGSIAQNSGDPYGPGFDIGPQGQAILARAMQSQMVTTVTMKIKGQLVSEFVNTSPMPGLMFGWAPEALDAVAFAGAKRRLVVMDQSGRRHEVPGTAGVLLPAWSPDGSRLVWLEQDGSRKFTVKLAGVSRR